MSGAKVTMLFSVVFLYAPVCFYAALNHPRLASFPKVCVFVCLLVVVVFYFFFGKGVGNSQQRR